MYSSSPISWPSFKPLAQIVFEISCLQVENDQIYKGLSLRENKVIFFFKN